MDLVTLSLGLNVSKSTAALTCKLSSRSAVEHICIINQIVSIVLGCLGLPIVLGSSI